MAAAVTVTNILYLPDAFRNLPKTRWGWTARRPPGTARTQTTPILVHVNAVPTVNGSVAARQMPDGFVTSEGKMRDQAIQHKPSHNYLH
jgi:hypothetical protein